MLALLWLVPALPLLGFAILFVSGGRLPKPAVASIAVGAVAISAALALVLAGAVIGADLTQQSYRQVLWQWMAVGDFSAHVALRLDALSLVMMLVVSVVGFLIHLYSAEFMAADEDYSRFFAYMNLFVGAMLVLVLADNLLVLYVGWEGVGLCSYLLIGFWYRDPANGYAARKAFVMTRIGDTAMLIGIIFLFTQLDTLDIPPLLQAAKQNWAVGSAPVTAAAALLLGGALGKSAQLPLQTWLPDAMAGPTPVSALIHAATMVTAGVYLIARTHPLFELAPAVQLAVAVIGAATLLIAACAALAQQDLKRILAYSTMSQIGYMFLALGVGAWTAAIFHLVTHAFFKALLFLAAGAVMIRINDEHNIFRMGGLRRELPTAFISFLIGAASLAALPLVTAGFYSKDMILWATFNFGAAGKILWAVGLLGAFLTGVYIFRAVFVVFFGERHIAARGRSGWRMVAPLAVLSVLAIVGGFLDMPSWLGPVDALSRLLDAVLPANQERAAAGATQLLTLVVASLAALGGLLVAFLLYGARPARRRRLLQAPAARLLDHLWLAGWGFDWLYNVVLVRPFIAIARLSRNDPVDAVYLDLAWASRLAHAVLARTESGRMRWYAGWIAAGSLVAIAVAVFT